MRFILVSLFCLILPQTCFSQMSSNPYVKLVEKKTGKRLQLYAENTDSIPYMAFLRVTTKDYRRTSKRPILKEIPGNSKLLLKTLILLEGKEGIYDATFIVNEVTTNLVIRKSKEFDIKISEAKIDTKVLIFTNSNCNLCEEALTILKKNAFNFEHLEVTRNNEAWVVLEKEFDDLTTLDNMEFPIMKIDGQLYTDLKTRQQFITILKAHFK